MIYSHRSLLTHALLVLLVSGNAQAQRDKNTPSKEEVAALREKSFKLLESIATELNTLQSPENRARMASNLIESLWKHDEERARAMMRLVQEDINNELRSLEPRPMDDNTVRVFLRLRTDTVDRIAKNDPEAALEFFTATAVDGEKLPPDVAENDQAVRLRLAKQVAANNPEMALKVGRQSLERGYSRDIISLIARLNRKHRSEAQTLYKDAVEKLRGGDVDNDWRAREFAQSLVQEFVPPDADEATYREFVGFLLARALELGCGKKMSDEDERTDFCGWVANSLKQAEKFDPRIARLSQWKNEGYDSSPLSLIYEELNELYAQGDWNQIQEIAAKYPETRSFVYVRSLEAARKAGDYEKALKLMDSLPGDPEEKQRMREYLEREQSRDNLDAKLEMIQKELEGARDNLTRSYLLIAQANLMGEKNRDAGLKLLNQANDFINTLKPGKDQTRLRIVLAMIYCYEKSDRGFAIMESLVPKLNELVDIAVKLDGYDTNYLRNGEWNMSANGAIGEILTEMSQQAAFFAWSDFDRAVSLASQFERPEIRLMAHLKLAQSILNGPPNRFGP
jgi:predicted DNA-binding protein YlxM (UPF0122 family)